MIVVPNYVINSTAHFLFNIIIIIVSLYFKVLPPDSTMIWKGGYTPQPAAVDG